MKERKDPKRYGIVNLMEDHPYVQGVPAAQVKKWDEIRFNCCNHWDQCTPPDDYQAMIKTFATERWIDYFHTHYSVLVLPIREVTWMKMAARSGSFRYQFPDTHREELDRLVKELDTGDLFTRDKKYFVRGNHCSLKEGKGGAGPYTNLKSIIESLVTCPGFHSPLAPIPSPGTFPQVNAPLKLYLLPWRDDLLKDHEFRVFVYNQNVVAISQQFIYEANQYYQTLEGKEKSEWIFSCIRRVQDMVQLVGPRLNAIGHSSYVMDVCLLDEPYFIEINPYGEKYSSGSSLFHWIHDGDILMGEKGSDVHFRITI